MLKMAMRFFWIFMDSELLDHKCIHCDFRFGNICARLCLSRWLSPDACTESNPREARIFLVPTFN